MRIGLREKAMLSLLAGGILIGGIMLAMMYSIQERMRLDLSRATATRYVMYHREKTLGGIQGDLALAQKMADSDPLRRWVLAPQDKQVLGPAVKELASFVALFTAHASFAASARTGGFYYFDEKWAATQATGSPVPTQILDTKDKDDEWFFNTLAHSDAYNFNVDHNDKLGVTKLWINVVMKDGDRSVGVVGTGVDISRFVEAFVKTSEPGVTGMYLTDDGAIQGHADVALIELNAPVEKGRARSTVWKLLADDAERNALKAAMADVKSGGKPNATLLLTLNGVRQVAAVAYLPPLRWYTVAFLDVDKNDVGNVRPIMAVLLVALALAGGLVLLVGNRHVVVPLRNLSRAANRVSDGDYDIRLPEIGHDEVDDVAESFNRMAEKLAASQRLLKTNIAGLSATLQRAGTCEELAAAFFSNIAPLLGIGYGSLYRVAADWPGLALCGGYARTGDMAAADAVPFGEGLVGQCAVERTIVQLDQVPPHYFAIESALAKVAPSSLLIVPVTSGDALVGVMELASVAPLPSESLTLLQNLLPVIAMRMETFQHNVSVDSAAGNTPGSVTEEIASGISE